MIMPVAESRLPMRAVAGEFIRWRPDDEERGTDDEGQLYQVAQSGLVIGRPSPAASAALSAAASGRLLNICSIRSVTT